MLEPRVHPSGSPVFLRLSPARQIIVQGTAAADVAIVRSIPGGVVVNLNHRDYRFGTISATGASILFRGKAGNDFLESKTALRVFAFGDAGDDTLVGGSSDDVLFGGPGRDRLVGGDGCDRLVGGEGNDILYGGYHADFLDGGPGDDYLAGGPGIDCYAPALGHDLFNFTYQAGVSVPAATSAMASPNVAWQSLHHSFVDIARTSPAAITFIGDSLTAFWLTQGQETWAESLLPLRSRNFGISGDATQLLQWRLQNGELEGVPSKVAVVLVGTNNLTTSSPTQTAQGIVAVVETIRELSPTTQVLLLGLLPRGASPMDPYRAAIDHVNEFLAPLGDLPGVRYLNFGTQLLAGDGVLAAGIAPDGLHLSSLGYRIWLDNMLPTLQSMLQNSAN